MRPPTPPGGAGDGGSRTRPRAGGVRCPRPGAERARRELRAAGRVVAFGEGEDTGAATTAQEHEIAEQAASRLTNKYVAERLFISHRTVGGHLNQVYPKLGIASRVMMRDALRRQDRL
ncbi:MULTISPECIES: helix-turn-helix transcriptional regulator [unclassified Streptomyces]|uniref:helix-turn-helix transcriptional regulator n=1 Tax=unclassified Streptomyces TaxID=2593676 RepID=UPI0033FC0D8A